MTEGSVRHSEMSEKVDANLSQAIYGSEEGEISDLDKSG